MSEQTRQKRRPNERRRAERKSNRLAMILLIVAVGIFAAFMWSRVESLKAKEAKYQEREAEIAAQVAEQEERAQKLEEYQEYVGTDEYIEKTAKEKLGLVNPDEILLKPAE